MPVLYSILFPATIQLNGPGMVKFWSEHSEVKNMTQLIKKIDGLIHQRSWMASVLVVTDLLGVFISCLIAIFFWRTINPTLVPAVYVSLIPFLLEFIVLYALMGLYPSVGVSRVEELKRLSIATSIGFLTLATLTFRLRNAESYSRGSFFVGWMLALVALPAGRKIIRSFLAAHGWWGEPVIIFGDYEVGAVLFRYLERRPRLGMVPVALVQFNDGEPPEELDMRRIRQLISDEQLSSVPQSLLDATPTAIIVPQEVPALFRQRMMDENPWDFKHIILVSSLSSDGHIWYNPFDIGGIVGLDVTQNLLSNGQRFTKRVIDLVAVTLFSPLILILFALLALIIIIDSPGKVFFRHTRVGREGKPIRVWKFRTMVSDADEVLEDYLEQNPVAKREWDDNHKLKDDPRVTRVGKFLRRSSLDELPQLINILTGEMSLVGPRPIVEAEIANYGRYYQVYQQVKPGLTGLWQISGRNDVDYQLRVQMDYTYVRNWSVWLDLYILVNTPFAVLSGTGAY